MASIGQFQWNLPNDLSFLYLCTDTGGGVPPKLLKSETLDFLDRQMICVSMDLTWKCGRSFNFGVISMNSLSFGIYEDFGYNNNNNTNLPAIRTISNFIYFCWLNKRALLIVAIDIKCLVPFRWIGHVASLRNSDKVVVRYIHTHTHIQYTTIWWTEFGKWFGQNVCWTREFEIALNGWTVEGEERRGKEIKKFCEDHKQFGLRTLR